MHFNGSSSANLADSAILPTSKSLHLLSKFSSQYLAIPSVIPYIYAYKSEPINVKHLPNIITALRIVGSIGLLFCNVAGWQFWTLYVFCGISDMIDGWFARKLQAESKTGAVLDSIADLSFMACCAIQLLPILSIPLWLWIWAGIIVIIKIVNQKNRAEYYNQISYTPISNVRP